MQWSADRNAGFSRANPQSLYLPVIIDPAYHYETVNVEAQEQNPSSLWWWMKRMIALRKRFAAFGRGSVEFLLPRNRRVLAFVREYGDETLLIVANLSRFAQCVELDLSRFRGRVPVELFGRSEFPAIHDTPYFLSLGPHSFFWFSVSLSRRAHRDIRSEPSLPLPSLKARGSWSALLDNGARKPLEAILPAYIVPRRWFRSKTSTIDTVEIADAVAVSLSGTTAGYFALLRVSYTDRDPQSYVLPLQFVSGAAAKRFLTSHPHAAIAELVVVTNDGEERGLLCDASFDPGFALALLDTVERERESASAFEKAVLRGVKTKGQDGLWGADATLTPRVGRAEQSNTSIVFGERFILKLYRSIEAGLNPDVELSAHLTGLGYAHSAPLAGQITYHRKKEGHVTVGALFGFVPNNGDAWQYTQDEVEGFYERAASVRLALAMTPLQTEAYLKAGAAELPNVAYETAGSYFETARLLGQRTAEMHRWLAEPGDDPSFEPETFTPFYRRALYQSLRNATRRGFSTLRAQLATLPEEYRETAEFVIASERRILRFFQDVLGNKIDSLRIRVHGDYHLGQVLYTGRDFVIIDFEGEPTRSLNERRIKRCALIDVAGMLRSFQYAAYNVLYARTERVVTAGEKEDLRKWAFAWYQWVGRVFLDAYLGAAERRLFGSTEEIERLMKVYVLEKAIYELAYELDNRPQWVRIPLAGIFHLIQTMDENVPSERSQPKT
jgi:maltose alpha-D-glucosyltransferase/alpha-amylase